MRCTCFPPNDSLPASENTCCVVSSVQEVAEPLQDLKEGMEQLEKNKTLRYILSTLLAIGNFLNSSNVSRDLGLGGTTRFVGSDKIQANDKKRSPSVIIRS